MTHACDQRTEPWGTPPFPDHGDEREADVFQTMGNAISEWEYLEYQLAHLHSCLEGRPGQIRALRDYGVPIVFSRRIEKLRKAAAHFFASKPNEEIKGKFDSLAERISLFAARRNEIAHSTVKALQWIHPPIPEYEKLRGKPREYACVPALYTDRKLDETHRPTYIYTTNELMRFALEFHSLAEEALHLKMKIERMLRP
jgi:hypothetical protein